MPSPARSASEQALDHTYDILRDVLESLEGRRLNCIGVQQVHSTSTEASRTSFCVETGRGVTRRVHCSLAQDNDGQYWVRVVFDEGPKRRFTFAPKVDGVRRHGTRQLGRAISAVILNELNHSRTPEKHEIPPHVPRIELNQNGTIERMNAGALRALEYSTRESLKACFFSHVHRHNLRRVMHDLAGLIERKLQQARWLLRLRTGKGRYSWFRARAENVWSHSTMGVEILLRPL